MSSPSQRYRSSLEIHCNNLTRLAPPGICYESHKVYTTPHGSSVSGERSQYKPIPRVSAVLSLSSRTSREILYQAVSPNEPQVISISLFNILWIRGNYKRTPQPTWLIMKSNAQTEALLEAGGKWKIRNGEFKRVTLTIPAGIIDRQVQIPTAITFYFRPGKDILHLDSIGRTSSIFDIPNITISHPEVITRLAVNLVALREQFYTAMY